MKSVVMDNTNRNLLRNLRIETPNTNGDTSASTAILPKVVSRFPATPAARRKRKAAEAADSDAGVVKASKKLKQESESEGLRIKKPAEQSTSDVVNHTVQSCSSDPQPAPKITKSRKIKSPKRNQRVVTTGFDRLRNDGIFFSNVPAEKSAEHTRPPVPLFSQESTMSVDGAGNRKDIPDDRYPYDASSNGKVDVGGAMIPPKGAFPEQGPCPVANIATTINRGDGNISSTSTVSAARKEAAAVNLYEASSNGKANVGGAKTFPVSAIPDQKPSLIPDLASTNNLGNHSMSNRTKTSATHKKAAAAVTSSEIRSWMSIKPKKIPGPKDVGSCDKTRLPGTDTKLLPCHLLWALDWRTREARCAADMDIVIAALATRRKKSRSPRDSSAKEPKGVKKNKKTDAASDRINKKQAGEKRKSSDEKNLECESSSQDSQPRQRQDASAESSILGSAPPLEMPHSPSTLSSSTESSSFDLWGED